MRVCSHFSLGFALLTSTTSSRFEADSVVGGGGKPRPGWSTTSIVTHTETTHPSRDSIGSALSSVAELASEPDWDHEAWDREFESETFDQVMDHTNAYHQQADYLNSTSTTFAQGLRINLKAWRGVDSKAPFFVVIPDPLTDGREEDYGLIGEMSREMGAMVIFIDARFSPPVMPFGKESLTQQANRVGLMSAENVMRDIVLVISHIRDRFDPEWVCPLGVFGDRIAGMYAAWMRFKFPTVVDFAAASDATMLAYPGIADPYAFSRIYTETWLDSSGGDESCVDLVRDSILALLAPFHECFGTFFGHVRYEADTGSYPPQGRIKSLCQAGAAKKAAGGSPVEVALALCGEKCNGGSCPWKGWTPKVEDYVRCTHWAVPIGSDGQQDFFPNWPYSASDSAKWCKEDWNVEPPTEGKYNADLFGWHRPARLASSVSRIVFAYGTYSPWSAYAISKTDISAELPTVMATGGATAVAFRGKSHLDTDDVLSARRQIAEHVARWVEAV